MATVTITDIPEGCDDDVPYAYDRDAFMGWVWEVFQEGYKKDVIKLSFDESIALVESFGYALEVECDDECTDHTASCNGYCDHIGHENACLVNHTLQSNGDFLRSLADRLAYVPTRYKVDEADVDRLKRLAGEIDGHLA